MKLLLLVACLALVAAQVPQRCITPSKWHAHRLEMSPSRSFESYARISYDAIEERIALYEEYDVKGERKYENKILLFKQQTAYVFVPDGDCKKTSLNETFRPIEVPPDAEFYGTRYIGAKEYGLGVEVDLWGGDTSKGRYGGSWTRVDCLPVEDIYVSQEKGLLISRFYDVEMGFDPNAFVPPQNCQ